MKDLLLTNPGSGVSNLIVDKKIFICLGGLDGCILSDDKDFLIRALYYDYTYDVLKENLVIERKHEHQQVTDINKDFLIALFFFLHFLTDRCRPAPCLLFFLSYFF